MRRKPGCAKSGFALKTFLINLESSLERRDFMVRQLEALGLEYEVFRAVEGRKFTQADIERHCDMKTITAWPQLFTPGMIGCILSHYEIYKEIVTRDLPYACVLEDDVKLSPVLPGILTRIGEMYDNGTLKQGEPVLLYYRRNLNVEFSTHEHLRIDDTYSAYRPVIVWAPITTAAYVLSRSTAERLIEKIYPVRCTPDSWGVFYREGWIDSLRCVLPLPVESGFFQSDIGYQLDNPFHRLIRFLDRKDIFPVKQVLQRRRRYLELKQTSYRISDKKIDWEVRPDVRLTREK